MEKLIKTNVILIIFMLMAFLSPSILLATTRENSPLYLGITSLMEESQMGYAIGNPQNEGNGMKIINIVKYSSATSNDPTPMEAFCLKADTGFTNNRSTLNVSYNMKTQRDEIKQQNELLKDLVEATITEEDGTQISRYNALLATVDMLYLPGKSDEAQKQEIIKTVKKIARQEGTYDSTLETYPLTDDDITAIQQAVIWYFTNYGERNGKYDKLTNIDWLYYTLNGSDYYKLCEYNPNGLNPRYDAGQARSKQAEILYKYMISQAKERASQYGTTIQNVAPATVTTQKLTYKAEGQNYIIGPIRIDKNTGSSAFYSIDFTVKNNQAEINNYTLLNEQQEPTEEGTTIKDLVGKDFYLSVPKSSAQAIAIDINIKYDSKNLTLWADTTNNQEQPVLVPTIKKENVPTTLTVEPKELDLALRKYITKVNDIELTEEKARVPNVAESALTSGTTAEYKHKKDPVEVKTGDKVTYKLTIYNEGEKVGRATKVVDQLPTGLKFVRVVSGNFDVASYEEGTNTLNLARKTDNTTNLPAYTGGTLTSGAGTETIEIECQVTQEQGKTQKILTNVAWIAEQVDGETGEIITTQEGKDRDSEPSTKPKANNGNEINKDNMEDYTGNNNKEELNDKDYYYKGQQDDDDFEKLILAKAEGIYNLQIIKVDSKNTNTKLSGAQFKITLADGTTQEVSTNEQGMASVGPIAITQSGIDTITLEEKVAPEGYQKLLNSVQLEITKTITNGRYVVSNIETKNLQINGTGTVEVKGTVENGKISVIVPNQGSSMDLALRKYITKVNDIELTQEKTRVPNIEERALTSGTTAEYKHRKDPVEVKTGDKVTYKLTIYNEGEKVGRATKVIDQLPTGLRFVRVVSGNFEVASYEEGTNTLNLVRKTDNTTNLPAYTEGTLTSGAGAETIEIECQVTQEQGKTRKILTNVAWIAEQIDGVTGEVITSQEGKDRDSEPQTKPEVNKDNMENYIGNNNKEELDDKDNYYKGQQDDDDFEKLILQPIQEPDKTMDLALRKYITKVNDVELIEEKTRVPNIEEGTLTSGTTAEYKHKKDPVEVKTGDKVTYKLTIYNEGEKAGRATKVVDQLPTGLKFVRVVSGNFEVASYQEGTNSLNLARKADNTTNLPAYTEGTLTSGAGTETIEIECQVTQEQGATDKVLTNVAWIAEQVDGETGEIITAQEGKDRDSEPQTKPEVNKDNMENYTGNNNKEELNDKDYYYKGQQDDDDFEKLILPKAEGMYDFKLVKVDEQDNNQKLKGAEFNITLADGTKQTITTNENGTIDINAITITQEGTDTITIEETKAPEGYYRLINSVTLKVTKQLVNGSYTITNVVLENNQVQGVQVTMEQNTAKLTVLNKKIQGSYQLQLTKVDKQNTNKKLAGSQFRVTLADGTQKDLTTDENGILQIPDINITKTGMDTITLEEIQAPSQYDKIVGNILLEVTKTVNKDKYIVSQVAIKENNNQATATVENNTVKVVVTNQKTPADFKLIKAIIQVNEEEVPQRIEKVDVSKLNTVDEKGNLITTGEYKLNKEPISVKTGDIITYTFRVYNEGMIDGYVQEITEDVPKGLQFLWSDKQGEELQAQTNLTEAEKEAISFNQRYLWGKFVYDEEQNIKQISSTYLAKENEKTAGENLIPAFGTNDGTKTEKDIAYKEIAVKFKVIAENELGIIRNEAAITQDANQDGEPVEDRDSDTEEWKKYEDDEDYDNIILKQFDLALRKFIIAVGNNTNIQESDYLKKEDGSYTREPVVDTSKLNTQKEDGSYITTATYNHIKEPITVQRNSIIIYMLRVYNEGDIDGYASEIKDHLPSNLAFVEGEFNQKYGWEVSEDGRTVTTKYLADKIIEKTKTENAQIVLAYQEVPIMCQVKEAAITNENITNIADITEYLDESKNPIKDRDSQSNNVNLPEDSNLPNYKDDETGSYIPGQQDDDDFEKILVREFDLALRKWVTQAIVIENGKETINQTGHDPWDDPEGIVKVELHRKKLDKVTVKFRYSIRVYNQGDIEGYAKEITDYIPEGLKFIPEENQGWTVKENNVISTRLLENTLLKPGEFADVEVLLTWKNAQDNIGLKTNIAEISEDYNEYGLPDKDSTPNNKKQGEDDIDDAPVMLSISTGRVKTYVILGMVILLTLGSGVFLIKKYVL